MAAITIARGSSFLLSKHLLTYIEPLNLLGLRFLLAFALLFLLFRKKCIYVIKNAPRIIGSALVLGTVYYLYMAAELYGLEYTTSSACSFLENTAIVIVPIIEAVLLRRMPKPVVLISTVVTVIGIGLIVIHGSDGSNTIDIGKGEVLCLIAALMYTAAIIITDRFSKKNNPMTLGILYVGFMGLFGLISSSVSESTHLPGTGAEWTALIVLAVLCTGFGFAMQPVAQEMISSETAGIICGLNPLTTTVLGWLLFGESLGISGITGAVLILSGILLPNLKGRRFLPCAAKPRY
jgi:drug/metabolite transporter (DMT)-like permease